MQARRDPYDFLFGEVLRLPPGTRDPDHYLLLGLPWFASGPERIRQAAAERLALLEEFVEDPRPGFAAACSRVRADVQEAQRVLLDPAHRKQYDALLIGRSAAASAPESAVDAVGGARVAEAPREARPPARVPTLPVGTTFAGRYRVMGLVRDGGFGEVLVAIDRTRRTEVHLSVLGDPWDAEDDRRAAARRAALDAAELVDPRIVRVDEVSEHEGRLYLLARPPTGVPLTAWISPDRSWLPPVDQVQRIALDLVDALDAAHEAGIPHGALDVSRIFVPDEGPVQVADFAVVRAVQDARTGAPRVTRGELFAEDREALGILLFLLLTGDVPDPGLSAGRIARALPEGVPSGLRRATVALAQPSPDRRPRDLAGVRRMLTVGRRRPRRRTMLAAAILLLVVVGGAALATFWPRGAGAASPAVAQAWQSITGRRFQEAVDLMRREIARTPEDRSLRAPLAAALEQLAHDAAAQDRPASAQRYQAEAQDLEPRGDRLRELRLLTRNARRRLAGVTVFVPPVTRAVEVRVDPAGTELARLQVGGRDVDVSAGARAVTLDVDEGPLEIEWVAEDVAGNTRTGKLRTDVDRTPPRIEVLAPAAGAFSGTAEVEVRLRVVDAHPPREVRVGDGALRLVGESALGTVTLPDGAQPLAIEATDLAGNRATTTVDVVVDTRAPRIELETARVVTPDGNVAVRGRVEGHDVALTVAGAPAALDTGGAFEAPRRVAASGRLEVVATAANGRTATAEVEVVVDPDPPSLSCRWERTASSGVLLYGGAEIGRGRLGIALEVDDASAVTLEPSEGAIEGDFWMVDATEGRRTVTIAAVDELGRRTTRTLTLEGRRAQPALVVECAVPEITNAEEATLVVGADAPVFLGEDPVPAGRRVVPLPEGRTTLVVRAVDRWGNETRWTRTVDVDRTPPVLALEGPGERPVGLQEIVVRADEPLAFARCGTESVEPEDEVARLRVDLPAGRRQLTVVARDLAGNETEAAFPVRVENRVLSLGGGDAVVVDLDPDLGEFTVECWVRGVTPRTRMVVVDRGGPDRGWSIAWSSVDTSLPYATFVSERRGFLSLPVRRGWRWTDWTHLALTWDGERACFFVDGNLRAVEKTDGPARPGETRLVIGGESDGEGGVTSHFIGAIDDLRLSGIVRYAGSFRPRRYHDVDGHTVLMLRFDVTAEDGSHPDSSGHGRDARAVGNPALDERSR